MLSMRLLPRCCFWILNPTVERCAEIVARNYLL